MATKTAGYTPKEKSIGTTAEAHRSIEEQTALFLKRGGQIQQIPKGTTGQAKLIAVRKSETEQKASEAV